jgi:hypothetical protein
MATALVNTPALSIREQAEAEVRKELAAKALEKMKSILRQRAAAEAVLKGFDAQILDLERQIADGTF